MLQFSETGKRSIYGNMGNFTSKAMIMARVGCEKTAKEFVKKAKQNLERMAKDSGGKGATSLKKGIGYQETGDGYTLYSKPKGNSWPAAVEFGRGPLSKPASEGPLYFRQLGIFRQTAKRTTPLPYFRISLRQATGNIRGNIGNAFTTVL